MFFLLSVFGGLAKEEKFQKERTLEKKIDIYEEKYGDTSDKRCAKQLKKDQPNPAARTMRELLQKNAEARMMRNRLLTTR